MKTSDRRIFLLQLAACSAAVPLGAHAQPARVEENDPQAVALGYKHDTTKVDGKKYPKHDAAQKCSNCQLFQGKPTDASGPCPLFGGKLVAGNGWCSAWVKKAA
ncbi:MAG: high-potential iron-sulfur protein [Caldimonas sp.]